MTDEIENSRTGVAQGLPLPIGDCRPLLERLQDYSTRGTDSPESLNLTEIRQISYALALYLKREG